MAEDLDIEGWRARLGRRGVWASTDMMSVSAAGDFARLLEELGYGALWVPETMGRDPFTHLAHLADRTTSLPLATGIANVHHRLPGPMVQAANALGEQSGGRFLLGMGVSHAPLVEGLRHVPYGKPLATMSAYLDGMDASPYLSPAPEARVPRLLAALGPKMLELAAGKADGVHPYWTTPAHTEQARAVIGSDKLLCVEQKVVLTSDASVAHETATAALSVYADLPNYRNNWLRLGFTEEQIDSRDPAFLDAVVAWGDVDAIEARLQEHLEAGADHVCVQALTPQDAFRPHEEALRALAPPA